MKASEVIRRYKAGERDFRRTNLRGQSFQGQDLSGADFSEADIRGTNFSHAVLNYADFSCVRAGRQTIWVVGTILLEALFVVATCLDGFINSYNFNLTSIIQFCITAFLATFLPAFLLVNKPSVKEIINEIPIYIVFWFVCKMSVARVTTYPISFSKGIEITFTFLFFSLLISILRNESLFRTKTRTNFKGTRLHGAMFAHAKLTDTDFSRANLRYIYWRKARIERSTCFDDTFQSPSKFKELLIEGNGKGENFRFANLSFFNLYGVDLEDADLSFAMLDYTALVYAKLCGAKLKQTQLNHANLTGVCLTGAYIENWSITSKTKLDDVQCEYVYMRVPNEQSPEPIRKPDNLDEFFQPGDFADFIRPLTDTLDLYHSWGADPRAISIAFKNLSQNHPEADLEIVAMEKRGQSSFNLKVRTAPTANKSALSAEYFDDYNRIKALSEARLFLLAEKDDRIRSLEQMIQTALHQPTFNVQGDFMPEQSRNINVGGDLNLSGSTLNLGEISGNVSNTINQLQNTPTPAATELADLLKQLQGAIESDSDLSDPDKAEALEQVGTLAKAGQNPQDGTLKKLANTAVKVLRGTVSALPDTAKLVESCAKLLPLITTLLGI